MAKTNMEILQTVARECQPSWSNKINADSIKTWEQAHLISELPDFKVVGNEIYDSLIERIGLTIIRRLDSYNQFASFKSADSLLLGKHSQEIGLDLIKGRSYKGIPGYNTEGQDQFAPYMNKPKAYYHTINRRDWYPTTLEEVQLRTAFTDMYGLNGVLAEQIAVLHHSDVRDEVIYTKKCFSDTLNGKASESGKIKLLPSQIVEVPDVRFKNDKASIAEFITTVRSKLWDMTFMKSCYNMAGITKHVPRGDMKFIIPANVAVNNEVNFLAQIFNENLAGIGQETIVTDDFGEGAEDLVAVACGGYFLSIRDVFSAQTTAANAVGLYTNKFWHHHQLYEISPFSNAIFFVAKK